MRDPAMAFADAMIAAGIGMPTGGIIANGEIQRFAGEGDRHGHKNCWYLLHADGVPAGAFGSWRSGFAQTWRHDGVANDPALDAAFRQTIARAKARAEQGRKDRQTAAARRAQQLYSDAREPEHDHAYLIAKAVPPIGVRQLGSRLMVPLWSIGGELWSFQTIAPDGEKRFLSGGRIKACFCPVGLGAADPDTLLIAEGWATAVTVHAETGAPVLAAMNAGNLQPVAEAARSQWPDAGIIIAGDDDHHTEGNPGKAKAIAAAAAVEGRVIFPDFDRNNGEAGTDFNDLHMSRRAAA